MTSKRAYKYEIFKIRGIKFIVKLDLNPITDEYDYHMYIRHLIMPNDAIEAYFLKTSEEYNEKYDRWELYLAQKKYLCFL